MTLTDTVQTSSSDHLNSTDFDHSRKKKPWYRKVASAVGAFIYQTPLEVAACGVGGIAAKIFTPVFAPALFGGFCSCLITRLSVEVFQRFDFNFFDQGIIKLVETEKKYSKIKILLVIFTLAIAMINVTASFFLAIALGILHGITCQAVHFKKLQTDNRTT